MKKIMFIILLGAVVNVAHADGWRGDGGGWRGGEREGWGGGLGWAIGSGLVGGMIGGMLAQQGGVVVYAQPVPVMVPQVVYGPMLRPGYVVQQPVYIQPGYYPAPYYHNRGHDDD